MSELKILYLNERKPEQLERIDFLEKKLLKMIQPSNVVGSGQENEVLNDKLNQEKILASMQVNGIQEPEKLTVLRFYTIVFENNKKSKKNEGQDNDTYNR